jgi:PadR family transcriptional regulator, regulatory protein PadR
MTSTPRHERLAPIAAGLLRPCLLAHLLSTSAYGYELHHRMVAIGLECDLGTVYRALNTMEDEGLLRSTWEMSQGGRSRRRYEINEAGAEAAEAYMPLVEQLVRVAHEFLDTRRASAGVHAHRADAAPDVELGASRHSPGVSRIGAARTYPRD